MKAITIVAIVADRQHDLLVILSVCLLLTNIGEGTVLLFMSHILSFVSIFHITSYSLFPVACWDNARHDVVFMSLGVIAESVTSSLASNFSADGITPRQIMHLSYAHYRDHRSIEKDVFYGCLLYLVSYINMIHLFIFGNLFSYFYEIFL